MSVALFLPTETEAGALAFAAGIGLGRIPCLPEYLDEDLARQNFATYPRGIRKLLGIFRVENGVAARVAGDAGPAAPVPPAKQPCGSGKHFTESADGLKGGPLPVIGSALADRALGGAFRGGAHA